jgi:hypothetical protein
LPPPFRLFQLEDGGSTPTTRLALALYHRLCPLEATNNNLCSTLPPIDILRNPFKCITLVHDGYDARIGFSLLKYLR